MRSSPWCTRRRLAVVVCALLPGITLAQIGPAMTGLTGRADDATAAFLSPAGTVRLDRPEVVVQASFVYTDSKFNVDAAAFSGGNADNDNEILVIPGAYYVRPVGERWRLNLSLNVPSGIGHDYGKKWSGRYLAEESTLAFLAVSATMAYKFSDRWSLAAGPYMIYTDSTSKARVNNLLPDEPDGSVRLEEDGAAVGLTLGTMYQLSESTRFGFTYRSSVEPELEGAPSFSNLDPVLREVLAAADLLGTEIDVNFKVPATAQFGFYTEFSDRWSMTGDVIWINMSEFGITRISIEQDRISVDESAYRDTWATSVGFKYRYRDDLSLAAGGLYAMSAVSDGRRGIGLPFDRAIGVGAGVESPCWGFLCTVNLNYFDLGDGDLSEDGGPLTGSIEGSFGKNWAVMLDFQLRKQF